MIGIRMRAGAGGPLQIRNLLSDVSWRGQHSTQSEHSMGTHSRDTVEQLRNDIDRGRTGDKIDGSDPAAVPLGTDEEAAGTPVPADEVARTRAREMARGRVPRQYATGLGAAKILFGFILVLVCAIVLWATLKLT
jgi:hypothetical protein